MTNDGTLIYHVAAFYKTINIEFESKILSRLWTDATTSGSGSELGMLKYVPY